MSKVSSREKAMKKLAEYEECSNEIRVVISIQRKIVDGKVKVMGCLEGACGPQEVSMTPTMQQEPMKEYHTDIDELMKAATEIVKAKAKALA